MANLYNYVAAATVESLVTAIEALSIDDVAIALNMVWEIEGQYVALAYDEGSTASTALAHFGASPAALATDIGAATVVWAGKVAGGFAAISIDND